MYSGPLPPRQPDRLRGSRQATGHRRFGSGRRTVFLHGVGQGGPTPVTAGFPSVRSGDVLQQRAEPVHIAADMSVEVAQADAARRDGLDAHLVGELAILADGDDGPLLGP